MIDINLYFIPIPSCLHTSGYNRTMIFDGYTREMKFIPNILNQITERHKNWQIKEILNYYPAEYYDTILEYLDYLNENRIIYLGNKNETKLFADFNTEWDFPALILNAIIEIKNLTRLDYFQLIDQLDRLLCFYLQINFLKPLSNQDISKLIEYAHSKSFRSINLTIDNQSFNQEEIENFIKGNPKINKVKIYSAEKDEFIKFEELISYIQFTELDYNSFFCSKKISPNMFSLRIEHFTESQLHNTCLNRKICIDSEGNIKNCPNMSQSYGNIKDTTLAEAIEKQGFKDCWTICKDKIDVCKDCEFRHICTDCRAFIKDPGNIYSQPAKCGYNPY
ncbi:MAG: grasp-with-spasm system SPASM domain peptide maturase, partial [Bacteroidales bacterium]|nr:grasp-with-spasm system SPASM domain peptide maturase [Bacteroidales bacterium]